MFQRRKNDAKSDDIIVFVLFNQHTKPLHSLVRDVYQKKLQYVLDETRPTVHYAVTQEVRILL